MMAQSAAQEAAALGQGDNAAGNQAGNIPGLQGDGHGDQGTDKQMNE